MMIKPEFQRSMGVKLVLVCGLALIMTIPAFYVASLVEDRTKRAAEVVKEISEHAGGAQTFLGPTLVIPYGVPSSSGPGFAAHGNYLVFPAQASATVKTTTEARRRSLFKVPVFQADLDLEAMFDLTAVPNAAPQGAELDWARAEIVVGVSDPRGALSDVALTAGAKTSTLVPADIIQDIAISGDTNKRLKLLGTRAGVAGPNTKFSVKASLRFSGAQRLALLAYGKSTQVSMQGDWPSPGFDGGFLPVRRSVSDAGFRAEWSVPFIARGVRAEGPADLTPALDATALGVSFIQVADAYQSVYRSLKYVLLFVGLIFLSFFVFEVTTGRRVHPAQYLLVGVAQIIFYLLLLALSERIGFDLAFLIGGGATVLLLSVNARWVFSSVLQGVRALVTFSLLYVLIYLLLRLEDNALLVGAIASFLAVAAAMYFTRGIDWYGSTGARQVDPFVPGNPS